MASMIVARAAARPVQAARCSSRPQPRQLAFRAASRAMYFHSRQSVVAAAAEIEEAAVEVVEAVEMVEEGVEVVEAVEMVEEGVEGVEAVEEDVEVEEVEEDVEVEDEVLVEDVPASSFAEKLAKLQAAEGAPLEGAAFSLNFLWLDKNIAVAVDQVFGQGQRSPVTEYFFWPRKDAWEELKAALDVRGWIGEREKVLLLNQCTEVINFWQTDTRPSLDEARTRFPNSKFQGS